MEKLWKRKLGKLKPEAFAGKPLVLDSDDDMNLQSEETARKTNDRTTTTTAADDETDHVQFVNPLFGENPKTNTNRNKGSSRRPTTRAAAFPAKTQLPKNKPTKRTLARRGSSFGAEESLEDRWSDKNIEHVRQLWSLTDQQLQQLVSMKDKLKDITHWKNNPYEVIRFVTGPQGYELAEGLFRAMIQWRMEHNVDSILDEYKPPRILCQYLPSAILQGYDREGDPVYLERGGSIDGHGLLCRYGEEKLNKHIIWSRELASRGKWIEQYERDQGRPPTRLTIVYDLQGLSARHMKPGVLPFLCESLRVTQQRYNGLAKRMIIIRAPALFSVAWGICKHAFPKNAQKKMVFSNPKNYLEVLEKYIDLDILPPCIYSDGKGCVAIGMPPRLEGGLIPDDISDDDELLDDEVCETVSLEFPSSDSEDGQTRITPVHGLTNVRCKRVMTGCWREQSSSQRGTKICCWSEVNG